MQYNQIYTLVKHPDYTVKIKTTAGFRPNDPRAAMDYFILEIGNLVFTTQNRIVKYKMNGGDEETLPGQFIFESTQNYIIKILFQAGVYISENLAGTRYPVEPKFS